MNLYSSQSIILFRFHENPEQARERIKMLRHFNPQLPIHVLFGGKKTSVETCKKHVEDLVESFWHFDQSATPHWKWLHGDLLHKAWYRDLGHKLDFDFLFSYEYDLLTLAPLVELYPNINENTIALAACEPFTEKIERSWGWTSEQLPRANFLKFCEYMNSTYGIKRQAKVCLGPGSLFSKIF